MTFWNRYARGIIWLAIVILFIFIGLFAVSGCQSARYEPPGRDLWLYVPKTQPSRL